MTKNEALKLALEALEQWNTPLYKRGKAITAIKEALAQPEQEPVIGTKTWFEDGKMVTQHLTAKDIYKDPEQPEQEPVTWRNAAIRVGEDLCSVGPFGYYDMTAKQWLDWALSVVTVHAPPPQRTWVGLTDDERRAIGNGFENDNGHIPSWMSFARAIEAKLKEKNT